MPTTFLIMFVSTFIVGVASGYICCLKSYTPTVELYDSRIADGKPSIEYYWDFHREQKKLVVTIGKHREDPRVITDQP